jgi:tetratricopeptide (TPR) repeat protein
MPNVQIFGSPNKNNYRQQAEQGIGDMMKTAMQFRQMAFERELAEKQMQFQEAMQPIEKGLMEAKRDRMQAMAEEAKLKLQEFKDNKEHRETIEKLNERIASGRADQYDIQNAYKVAGGVYQALNDLAQAASEGEEVFNKRKEAVVGIMQGLPKKFSGWGKFFQKADIDSVYSPGFRDNINKFLDELTSDPVIGTGLAALKAMGFAGIEPQQQGLMAGLQGEQRQTLPGMLRDALFGKVGQKAADQGIEVPREPTPEGTYDQSRFEEGQDDVTAFRNTYNEVVKKKSKDVAFAEEGRGRKEIVDEAHEKAEKAAEKAAKRNFSKDLRKSIGALGFSVKDATSNLTFSPVSYFGTPDLDFHQRARFARDWLNNILGGINREVKSGIDLKTQLRELGARGSKPLTVENFGIEEYKKVEGKKAKAEKRYRNLTNFVGAYEKAMGDPRKVESLLSRLLEEPMDNETKNVIFTIMSMAGIPKYLGADDDWDKPLKTLDRRGKVGEPPTVEFSKEQWQNRQALDLLKSSVGIKSSPRR